MQEKTRPVAQRRWLFAGLLANALLILGVALGAAAENPDGPFRDASKFGSCLGDEICAEWPFADGGSVLCCVAPEDFESGTLDDCIFGVIPFPTRDPDSGSDSDVDAWYAEP